MTVADLQYTVGTHFGENAYLFTINQRFTGYTFDKQLFHVLDRNDWRYTSYLRDELDQKLRENFFGNPNLQTLRENENENGNGYFSNWTARDYIGVGMGIIAVITFAVLASRN